MTTRQTLLRVRNLLRMIPGSGEAVGEALALLNVELERPWPDLSSLVDASIKQMMRQLRDAGEQLRAEAFRDEAPRIVREALEALAAEAYRVGTLDQEHTS